MHTSPKKLYRSNENKVIFGVMGGLGEYFDVDPVLVRIIYIVITLATAVVPGIVAYVLIAMIMPVEPTSNSAHSKSSHESSHHFTDDKI